MRFYTGLGLVFSFAAAGGCGSSGDTNNANGAGQGAGGGPIFGAGGGAAASAGAATGTGDGSVGTNNGGTSGGTAGHGTPVTSVTPVDNGNACASQSLGAAAGGLDIFIMLDKSQSMSDQTASGSSKWDVITQSLVSFVNDPKSAGIEAGLGFFGIATGGNRGGVSCTAADYANPVVPIAALPPNASAISGAIGQQGPGGNTPTEPALQGAIDYALSWAQRHPTHKVIVVFATDGLPNGCNSSVTGAASVAASGVTGTPSIPTYVIGVFGDQDCPGGVTLGSQCTVIDNTNQIAKGGGTNAAFIVNASGNTGAQFLQALNSIRTANLAGCDFAVPAPAGGSVVDFSRASVSYTPGNGGGAVSLNWVPAASACDPTSGGWYYNSATAPNHMLLCDASCKQVTGDPNARVDVRLACLPPGTPGAGGAGSGGAPGMGGSGTCLLDGQSCTSSDQCCTAACSGGICGNLH